MARATTRRARNDWRSARVIATLAMVFAVFAMLATPSTAGAAQPVPSTEPTPCASSQLGDAQPSHSRVVPALAVSVGLNLAFVAAEVRRRRHSNRVADENTPLMY